MSKLNIDKKEIMKCVIIFILFIIINVIFRNTVGSDYYIFLEKWIEQIIENGKINSLSVQIGNYTPPYMYFLILGTYLTTNYVFWIKLVSNIFSIGMGIVIYYIIKVFRKNIKLSSGLVVILIPSVFLNSSIIGQCDSIYTFFVLLFVLLILKDRKRSALFFYGVALSFKLQAIFVAPVFLYLLLKKKIKIIDLIYVTFGFVFMMIPSLMYGNSLIDILKIMFNQTKENNEIVSSAPNIYSLLHLNYVQVEGYITVILSIIVILFSVFVVLRNVKGKEYSNKMFLEKVMLLSIFMPYFLPSMHDRYFYMANIFFYIYIMFVDGTLTLKSRIIHFGVVAFSCALPTVLFNISNLIGSLLIFNLCEWLGVTFVSSTMMTYIIFFLSDRYLSKSVVVKKQQ